MQVIIFSLTSNTFSPCIPTVTLLIILSNVFNLVFLSLCIISILLIISSNVKDCRVNSGKYFINVFSLIPFIPLMLSLLSPESIFNSDINHCPGCYRLSVVPAGTGFICLCYTDDKQPVLHCLGNLCASCRP